MPNADASNFNPGFHSGHRRSIAAFTAPSSAAQVNLPGRGSADTEYLITVHVLDQNGAFRDSVTLRAPDPDLARLHFSGGENLREFDGNGSVRQMSLQQAVDYRGRLEVVVNALKGRGVLDDSFKIGGNELKPPSPPAAQPAGGASIDPSGQAGSADAGHDFERLEFDLIRMLDFASTYTTSDVATQVARLLTSAQSDRGDADAAANARGEAVELLWRHNLARGFRHVDGMPPLNRKDYYAVLAMIFPAPSPAQPADPGYEAGSDRDTDTEIRKPEKRRKTRKKFSPRRHHRTDAAFGIRLPADTVKASGPKLESSKIKHAAEDVAKMQALFSNVAGSEIHAPSSLHALSVSPPPLTSADKQLLQHYHADFQKMLDFAIESGVPEAVVAVTQIELAETVSARLGVAVRQAVAKAADDLADADKAAEVAVGATATALLNEKLAHLRDAADAGNFAVIRYWYDFAAAAFQKDRPDLDRGNALDCLDSLQGYDPLDAQWWERGYLADDEAEPAPVGDRSAHVTQDSLESWTTEEHMDEQQPLSGTLGNDVLAALGGEFRQPQRA
jgi:hypothetical protein